MARATLTFYKAQIFLMIKPLKHKMFPASHPLALTVEIIDNGQM